MADYGKGDTSWFVQDRFGMFIHWGTYALAARHEWVKNHERIPNEEYQKYFAHFNPDLYEPKKWARAAAEAGMKYFVITTKHHEGFCLWDSKFTDYKATNTPCGKDLLRPMVDAFREEGLRVGFYYSLIDWHHPHFVLDPHIGPYRDHPDREKMNEGRDQKIYAQYMRDQVRELLTDFGPVDILWFDFSYPKEDGSGKGRDDWESEDLVKMIRDLQPNVMIDNRLDLPGVGDFVTPEQFQPTHWPTDDKGEKQVWEACQTFSGSWGYFRDEASWKSVKMLLWMLIDGVSKGGNLLLNVGPTGRGEFDDRAMDRLAGMGKWMRVHGRSIYGCTASDFTPPPDCRYTQNGDRLYLHVMNWPFKAIHLPGLAGKVKYAQLLNDASEVRFRDAKVDVHANLDAKTPEGDLTLEIPIHPPAHEIPVIELFLK